MKRALTALLAWLAGVGPAFAQEPVHLREAFAAGYIYKVSSRVQISGRLDLPPQKDAGAPKTLPVRGSSAVDYFERVLSGAADGKVQKTVRLYERIDFARDVGPEKQKGTLRPEVRRLVLLRHGQKEVPFSPAGPLTWGEIDLIRTDVFTPALAGLLPTAAVRPGSTWSAAGESVLELTDLEKVEAGKLTCRFESVTSLGGRRLARVAFAGELRGLGEDGPTRHRLDGYLLFDLESNHVSYLSLSGTQFLISPDGKTAGQVDGTFVLSRQPFVTCRELSDEGLRGVALEPTEENTQLLYDNPQLGVRFLHPRRWRVAQVNGPQIALDESRGSGLLITLEPPGRVPSGALFFNEARTYLSRKKARLLRTEPPRAIPATGIEQFGFDAEVDRQRVWLDYYIVRQGQSGATVAARLLPTDLARLRSEAAKIVRSLQLSRPR